MSQLSTVAAFIDIDQTLMFSTTATKRLGVPPGELKVVEMIDDVPAGFVHADLPGRLAALNELALIVPSTTRSLLQYRRVQLFSPLRGEAAVVANGALLVIDGQVDDEWTQTVTERTKGHCAPLREIGDRIARCNTGTSPGRVYVVESRFFCVVTEDAFAAERLVSATSALLGGSKWSVSRQGKKVYIIPDSVSKGAAVDEIVRRFGVEATTAAGDSVLDIDMMRRADLAIVPRHATALSTICGRLSPVITNASGPASSVEIVERMIAFAVLAQSGGSLWMSEHG